MPILIPSELAHAIWKQGRPIVLRQQERDATSRVQRIGLGSLCALSRIVAAPRPRFPQARVVSGAGTVHPDHYRDPTLSRSLSEREPCATFFEHLEQGRTLVFAGAEDRFPALAEWLKSLVKNSEGKTSANFYFSNTGARGFPPHYDLQHVLVLQTAGVKRWKIYAPLDEEVAKGRPCPSHGVSPGKLLQSVDLGPGDILLIPRGFVHSASAQKGLSVHVSLSFTPSEAKAHQADPGAANEDESGSARLPTRPRE